MGGETPPPPPGDTVDGTDFDPGPRRPRRRRATCESSARGRRGVHPRRGRPEGPERAWQISHPDLKRDCSCTKKEWLTGNINVQYFPTKGLQGASFTVNEVGPGRVVLEVLLTPKPGSEVPATAFYIGLKKVKGKWLVDYWAPHSAIPVPQQG